MCVLRLTLIMDSYLPMQIKTIGVIALRSKNGTQDPAAKEIMAIKLSTACSNNLCHFYKGSVGRTLSVALISIGECKIGPGTNVSY